MRLRDIRTVAIAAILAVNVSCAARETDLRITNPAIPGALVYVDRRLEELRIDGRNSTTRLLRLDAGPHVFELKAVRTLDFGAGLRPDVRIRCDGSATLREGITYDLKSRVQESRLESPPKMSGGNWVREEFVVEVLDSPSGDRIAIVPCEPNLACSMQGRVSGKTTTMNCDAFEKRLRDLD